MEQLNSREKNFVFFSVCVFYFYCFVTLMLQSRIAGAFHRTLYWYTIVPVRKDHFLFGWVLHLFRQSIVVRFVWRAISLSLLQLLLVLVPRQSSHRLVAACCVATLRTAAVEPMHTAARASGRLSPSNGIDYDRIEQLHTETRATCSPTNSVLFAWIMFGIQS